MLQVLRRGVPAFIIGALLLCGAAASYTFQPISQEVIVVSADRGKFVGDRDTATPAGFMTWSRAIDYCQATDPLHQGYCTNLHYGPSREEALVSIVSDFCFSVRIQRNDEYRIDQTPNGPVIAHVGLTEQLRDMEGFYARALSEGKLPPHAPSGFLAALAANGCTVFNN